MRKKNKDRIIRRKSMQKAKPIKKVRKEENKKKPFSWRRLIFIFGALVFFGVTIYVFFCSTLVSIDVVNVTGTERTKDLEIEQIVEDKISGDKFGCIKNNNYFFVNIDDVKYSIEQDKRIKEATITKSFPKTLNIEIEEFDVIAVWCIKDIHGECFIVEDGKIVEPITFDSEMLAQNKYFVVVDKGRESVQVGESVITDQYLQTISFLGNEFKYAISVGIEQPYTVLSRGSYEARFQTDEGWYILVDITQSPEEILDTIALFFKKVELPARRNDLEYLDMRFPERVFYKMKDGVEQTEEELKQENEEKSESDNKDEKEKNK
jgi:cell division septal protein FtsQ